MRMRRKKHGDTRREALSALMIDPEALKNGSVRDFFENKEAPLHLEIGCGKGDFAIGMAMRHPEINFIAMERVADVILCAMEKCAGMEPGEQRISTAEELPKNIRFLLGNANELVSYFRAGEIDALYLNFSDPWPKSGHEKRRLTYVSFLKQYQSVLVPNGKLTMKTDNRALFDYSLESFAANGWETADVSYDLHHSEWNEGNIETEYERNFSAKGFSINRVVATAPLLTD